MTAYLEDLNLFLFKKHVTKGEKTIQKQQIKLIK